MKSSLFDDEAPASKTNPNLFDDEPTPAALKTSANLFADDDSPWGRSPKKSDKASLVKNLLSGTEVPDGYVDAYDALLSEEEPSSGGISANGVNKILGQSGIGAGLEDQIKGVLGLKEGSRSVGRGEFNVLMALIGLAQEGEETTLDGVDERRRSMCLQLSFCTLCSTNSVTTVTAHERLTHFERERTLTCNRPS